MAVFTGIVAFLQGCGCDTPLLRQRRGGEIVTAVCWYINAVWTIVSTVFTTVL